MTDPTRALHDVASSPELSLYVRWVQPADAAPRERLATATLDLMASGLTLVAMVASLIATSASAASVYRTERARVTAVRWLYGWPRWRVCARGLVWETAATAVVVVLVAKQVQARLAGAAGSPRWGEQVALAQQHGVLAAVVLLGAICSLWWSLGAACRQAVVNEGAAS